MSFLTVRKGDSNFIVFHDNNQLIYIAGRSKETDLLRLSATSTQGVLLEEYKLVYDIKNSISTEVDEIALADTERLFSSNSMPRCLPQDQDREVELSISTTYQFRSLWTGGNHALAEARIRPLLLDVESK